MEERARQAAGRQALSRPRLLAERSVMRECGRAVGYSMVPLSLSLAGFDEAVVGQRGYAQRVAGVHLVEVIAAHDDMAKESSGTQADRLPRCNALRALSQDFW